MNCLKDPSLPLLELQVGWFHTVAKGIGVVVVSSGTSTSPPGPSLPWRCDELPEGPQPAPSGAAGGLVFTSDSCGSL